jgi:hypothetical protein
MAVIWVFFDRRQRLSWASWRLLVRRCGVAASPRCGLLTGPLNRPGRLDQPWPSRPVYSVATLRLINFKLWRIVEKLPAGIDVPMLCPNIFVQPPEQWGDDNFSGGMGQFPRTVAPQHSSDMLPATTRALSSVL